MSILHFAGSLFLFDTKTLIGALVWGDLAFAALAFGYYRCHHTTSEKSQIRNCALAKLLQSLAWFLLLLKNGR